MWSLMNEHMEVESATGCSVSTKLPEFEWLSLHPSQKILAKFWLLSLLDHGATKVQRLHVCIFLHLHLNNWSLAKLIELLCIVLMMAQCIVLKGLRSNSLDHTTLVDI